MTSRFNNNNQRTKKSPLPNPRKNQRSGYSPTQYSTNMNRQSNYTTNYNKPAVSFGLFNYADTAFSSPFYAKKINDISNRKYKNKLNRQQQYWTYSHVNKSGRIAPNNLFLNALPSKSTDFKPTDLDYRAHFSYLNQVIPPTPDAIDEYNRSPLDITDIPPPSQSPSYLDNIETIFTNKPVPSYSGLGSEEARQALIRHVSNNYCLNKAYAKKMHILNIENSFIYTISLESFAEKRQTSWAYEPYQRPGGYVDDQSNGQTPPIWDIVPLHNPKPFRDHVETMVIPHSETIRSCFVCKSTGRIKCSGCHGVGFDKCYAITHKIDNGEPCFQCEGGRKKCYNCNGYGLINCKVCLGSGQLKCFLKLTITWKNHIDEYLPETLIPKDKLKFISGDIIYNDTNVKVTPISYLTNRDLSKASERLINKHEETYFTQERPIMQRQLIQVINLGIVHYQYRNKLGIFYVIGKDQKVYAPSYPKNLCCSCCTII